ncbi:MAG TPA: ABC transporter ATP-binding protein [Alphaproteobacteria bacterium]|jgi:iron(III) transport system ATP-binding protein
MVRLQNIKKQFQSEWGQVFAIDNVNLEIQPGQLVTLLGPSGCGKTTTLRCLAGLEKPDEGVITIGSDTVFSSAEGIALPAYRRRIGMVFQSYAIWPHMSVYENVAFPLDGTGLKGSEVKRRVETALELVGLLEMAKRPAPQLSGGQQQRVALARALVAEPEVLLLDEPLCNLDAKLRVSMRSEIRALQKRLGITTVYVTHDQQEALAISDVVVVMSKGRIIEMGAPGELYERPKHRFTADFIGAANLVPLAAVPTRLDAGRWQAATPFGVVHLAQDERRGMTMAGGLLMIRPEQVRVSTVAPAEKDNTWPAKIVSATLLGNFTECVVDLKGHEIMAQIPGVASLDAGQDVFLHFPPDKCLIVQDDAAAGPEHVKDRAKVAAAVAV